MTTRTSRRQSSTVGTATQRTARPLALRNLAKCSLVIQRQSGQRPPKGAADLVFSQSGRRDSNSRPSPWQKETNANDVTRANVNPPCSDGRFDSPYGTFQHPTTPLQVARKWHDGRCEV